MIFDQFSRYKTCSELLFQAGYHSGDSVLDVGSGPECLFEKFIPGAKLTFVDPLIDSNGKSERIRGTINSEKLDDRRFDHLTVIDVLEHIPRGDRHAFIERLSEMSTKSLILGFPSSDSSDAEAVDQAINSKYSGIFDQEYPWLEEHRRYGLPSLRETLNHLLDLGWYCKTIGHGYAPWYRELLGFSVCVLTDPSLGKIVEEISEKFNKMLYPYDFEPPHYRQFIVASSNPSISLKKPGKHIINQEVEKIYRSFVDEAKNQYFSLSLRQLYRVNNLIIDLNHKIEDVSSWGIAQKKTIEELDKQILELNQKVVLQQKFIIDRDASITKLERTLYEKHAELMKMSDWASSMVQEINRLNSNATIRMHRFASRQFGRLKSRIKKTILGKIIRYVRDRRRFRMNYVSFENLRKSVEENNGRLIVTFPIITWDFRWQRPQQIVTRLRDAGYAVLYMAMTLIPKKRRYNTIDEAGADVRFNVLDFHIHQTWLHSARNLDIYTHPIDGDDLFNIAAGMRAIIRELCIKEIIYLIQFPGWGRVAIELKKSFGGKIVFDCMDDHSGFSTNTAEVLENEELIIKTADIVITSSNLLEEKAKKVNPCTILVKNGTEFEHFYNPKPNGELDHLLGKPIIGYYGAISDWFDMDIIAYCAQQRPHWNFVLIGSTFGSEVKKISSIGNVHLLGEKTYGSLPGYLAYFDVCTIPFKIIPLTLATNPVKFYEYLSAGKPVVSTALPELLQCLDNCYIAKTREEFLMQLESAIAERKDPAKIDRRIHCAQNNSWDTRVELILNSECFLGRT